MKAELKRAADLVAFQRREALARKRLSGDPRNPFRPRYGAELTFTAAAQEAETLGYIWRRRRKALSSRRSNAPGTPTEGP